MDKINEAFDHIDRRGFLPSGSQSQAGFDFPVPIGYGQTNSQPSTVRLMLQWLDPQPEEKILDVGSGSGWTTALLAHIVGLNGMVYAVEKVPELLRFGVQNCQQAGIQNARFFEAKDDFGLPKFAPYDRILVSAAADELPEELLQQLKVSGRLVVPVKSSIHIIDKTSENTYNSTEQEGFIFVPLVK